MDTFVAELDEEMHGINKVVVLLLVVVPRPHVLDVVQVHGDEGLGYYR